MSNQYSQDKAAQEIKGAVKKIMLASGAIFLIFGMFAYLDTKTVMDISGFNESNTRTASYALIAVGLADIFAVIILSRLREKR